MKVKEIMKKTITIARKAKIKEAIKVMSKNNIGSLVVAEKNNFFGILSERDIIHYLAKSNNLNESINKIMSKKIITIEPEYSLEEAANIMREHKIRRLPVVEKDKLLGIITATDIIENVESIDEPFFF